MAFQPTLSGFNSSLYGMADPARFFDSNRLESRNDLYEQKIHSNENNSRSIIYTLIIIIISAIIFVTIISLFDVIRGYITNYYANQALIDPISQNTPIDITRTNLANQENQTANITFFIVCIVISIFIIPMLLLIIYLL